MEALSPLTKTIPIPGDFPIRTDYKVEEVTIVRLSPEKLEKCGWAFYDRINTKQLETIHQLRQLMQDEEKQEDKIAEMIESLPESDRAKVLTDYLEKKERESGDDDDDEKDKVPADKKKPEDRTDEEVIGPMSKPDLITYGVKRVNGDKMPVANLLAVMEPDEQTWMAAQIIRWTDRQYRDLDPTGDGDDLGNGSGASSPPVS